MNIKSILEEEFPKMRVGSLINRFRPNFKVTASILGPSYVVLFCLYHFEDLLLKSPRATVRNGFWLNPNSNFFFISLEITVPYFQKSQIVLGMRNPDFPAGNYMPKVNDRSTRSRYKICSKLIMKTPERR